MRKSLLNVYLENITFRFPEWEKMDMDELISICMETYQSFPLKEHDKIGLQKQIIEQNKSLIIPIYADILDSLVSASEKVNIIIPNTDKIMYYKGIYIEVKVCAECFTLK